MKKPSKKLTQLLANAQKQIHAQDWSAALPWLLKAKPLGEDNYALLFQIGWAYMKLGQPAQARVFFERVESTASKKAVVLKYVGNAYMELGRWYSDIRAILRSMEQD